VWCSTEVSLPRGSRRRLEARVLLSDHISKEMNELNLIRCKHIPKRPGCDWHDLPDEKVTISCFHCYCVLPICLTAVTLGKATSWFSWTLMQVKLSSGQMVDLIPWCLPNTAKRHNQWKGLYGRLDWESNFPTSDRSPANGQGRNVLPPRARQDHHCPWMCLISGEPQNSPSFSLPVVSE
jgi:hypothetical protein